jgi:hypothetical protein
MCDVWETRVGLNPANPSDDGSDIDDDGLISINEFKFGTDPKNPATDAGGEIDGGEGSPFHRPRDPSDDLIGRPTLDVRACDGRVVVGFGMQTQGRTIRVEKGHRRPGRSRS